MWDDAYGFFLDDVGIFGTNPWRAYLAGLVDDGAKRSDLTDDDLDFDEELVGVEAYGLGPYLYVRAPA